MVNELGEELDFAPVVVVFDGAGVGGGGLERSKREAGERSESRFSPPAAVPRA